MNPNIEKRLKTGALSAAVAGMVVSGAAFAGAHQSATEEMQDDAYSAAQKMENTAENVAGDADRMADQFAAQFGVEELGDIEGSDIEYNGEEIGEIDRLAVDSKTGELLAVVGLNGVLGVNMKEVTIALSQLTRVDDDTLSTNISKEELQTRRDIDPWTGSFGQILDKEEAQTETY